MLRPLFLGTSLWTRLAFLLVLAPLSAAQEPCFEGSRAWRISAAPTPSFVDCESGDLDGDGDFDQVVAESNGAQVFVLMNAGGGALASPVPYPTGGNSISALALGDVDGDSDQDMVVCGSFPPNTLLLFLNSGNGTFGSPAVLPAFAGLDVAIRDVDGDGDRDIVALSVGAMLVVLPNSGGGVFGPGVTYGPAFNWAANLSLGDLDGDGDLDALVPGGTGTNDATILLNAGDGSFGTVTTQAIGMTNYVELADLDGDLDLDLAFVPNSPGTTVSIAPNLGNATFGPSTSYPYGLQTGSAYGHITAADLDGDGDQDLVFPWDGLSILRNQGNGVLSAPEVILHGGGLYDACAVDLDLDGDVDLAVSAVGISHFVTVLNQGNATFLPPRIGGAAEAVADMDLDGDGDVVSLLSGSVRIALNSGGISIGAPVSYPTGGGAGQRVAVGDLNGDGYPDVVSTHQATFPLGTGRIAVLFNQGNGALGTPVAYSSGVNYRGAAIGDVNGDGALDVVASRIGSPFQFDVLVNQGAGVLAAPVGVPSVSDLSTIVLMDLDGDGDRDLAGVSRSAAASSTSAVIHLNNGNGTFGMAALHPAASDVAASDLDADGDVDLAYCNPLSIGGARVLPNPGNGVFSIPAVPIGSADLRGESLAIADLDGDGDRDLVIDEHVHGRLQVLTNQGALSFSESLWTCDTDGGHAYSRILATDLDGDGDADVVAQSGPNSPERFSILRNCGSVGTTFCHGDGSGTGCPCGNNSSPGAAAGCLNSLGFAATLRATGSPSLSGDSVVLNGAGMPTSSALYFQGTTQSGGGAGAVFGDGLRCAAGSVFRLGTKFNMNNVSQYPVAGDQSVSVRGQVIVPGSRTYQVWYRNAAAFCTTSTFNLSNGVLLTWAP